MVFADDTLDILETALPTGASRLGMKMMGIAVRIMPERTPGGLSMPQTH